MVEAVFIWSGGKDSALALNRVFRDKTYSVKYILTTFAASSERVSMHGVRKILIESQAFSLGLPLIPVLIPEDPALGSYETCMHQTFVHLKEEGISVAIFGDIFLEDLKAYRQKQVALANLEAYFPLWGESSSSLVQEFVDLEFKAVLVCVSEARLGRSYLGKQIDQEFMQNLPPQVDPAGENGEYHSFVYAGPIFKNKVHYKPGQIICRNYGVSTENKTNTSNLDTTFWFLDLLPVAIQALPDQKRVHE